MWHCVGVGGADCNIFTCILVNCFVSTGEVYI